MKVPRGFVVTAALLTAFITLAQASFYAREALRPAQEATSQAVATISGELLEVDVKTSTFSVKTDSAEMEFRYNEQTKIVGAQKGIAGLATMSGAQVAVQYRKDGQANVATSIEVRSEKVPGR